MSPCCSFNLQQKVNKIVETEEQALVWTVVEMAVIEAAVSAVGEVYQSYIHQILTSAGTVGQAAVETGAV